MAIIKNKSKQSFETLNHKKIKKIKHIYLPSRFFAVFGSIAFLLAFGFAFPLLFPFAQVVLLIAVILFFIDTTILFSVEKTITGKRIVPHVFSLGDDNEVKLHLNNNSRIKLKVTIIDELPFQFQKRDFEMQAEIEAGGKHELNYMLNPKSRGIYGFGGIRVFLRTKLGLSEIRKTIEQNEDISVYPSLIQMKKYELRSIEKISKQYGIKKLRRIGHSYEFEQIKNYVQGDDFRSVNWKATGRKGELMLNQYEDEKSQQVFCILDNSRVMKMPFKGLSLFDYAVNASLVISNIALQKHDKTGLIAFSDTLETYIKPDRGGKQMKMILNALYNQKEKVLEANYELLYHAVRNHITNRSLLMLFTNFESSYMMERVLHVLRKLNKLHLLVVIFFENTEIADFSKEEAKTVEGIYYKTTAEKSIADKQQIINQLRQLGIQVVYTRPEDLSINTINKYLELKSRGLI